MQRQPLWLKVFVPVAAAIITAVVLFFSPISPFNDSSRVAAQMPTTCIQCHTGPISGNCVTCHPTPPQTVMGGVIFPHHDAAPGGPPDNCQEAVCHDGVTGSPATITRPVGSHTYCGACHDLRHS